MELDCIELERRLAIGFNEQLSLSQRHSHVVRGTPLKELSRMDPAFQLHERETRDVIHWLSKSRDNSIIWYGDVNWPSFEPLKSRLPYLLLCTGKKPSTGGTSVAIVGTRHATYAALQESFRFGLEAAENSMTVISGFAEGIDQSAMRGALEGNGPCIGVLACGHEVEYPSLTNTLRRRIVENGGCIISRFSPQTVAYKSNFISRNMIIAAYCNFTVAVQAPCLSGTLNTCDYTTQMGKDIYVGREGVGDRFVQAGTTAMFNDGVKMISSFTEGVLGQREVKYKVFEWSESCGECRTRRFGDRLYVVRECIN